MYRIIYILFKHVKFQYNNLVKYNSKYSVFSIQYVLQSVKAWTNFSRFIIY